MRTLLLVVGSAAGLALVSGCANEERRAADDRSTPSSISHPSDQYAYGRQRRNTSPDSGKYGRDTWSTGPEDPNAPRSAAPGYSDMYDTYDPNQRTAPNALQRSNAPHPSSTASANEVHESDSWDAGPQDPNAPKSAASPQSYGATAYDPNPRTVPNPTVDQNGNTIALASVPADLHGLLAPWPASSRRAAEEMIRAHGRPDYANEMGMAWVDRAPFLRICVSREPWTHNFPAPHEDVVEHVVAMRVSPEKIGELAAFDGSIHVMRTPGEVAARCDTEAMNIAALNLASDIVEGRKTVAEARDEMARIAASVRRGEAPQETRSLRFSPSSRGEAYADRQSSRLN